MVRRFPAQKRFGIAAMEWLKEREARHARVPPVPPQRELKPRLCSRLRQRLLTQSMCPWSHHPRLPLGRPSSGTDPGSHHGRGAAGAPACRGAPGHWRPPGTVASALHGLVRWGRSAKCTTAMWTTELERSSAYSSRRTSGGRVEHRRAQPYGQLTALATTEKESMPTFGRITEAFPGKVDSNRPEHCLGSGGSAR